MVIVQATKNSEAGVMPIEKLLADMTAYNEQSGVGRHHAGGRGPGADSRAGGCASRAEAVEWVRRCPGPMLGEEGEIEIRPVFEASDFGAEFMTGAPAARGPAARGVGLCCRQVMVFVATLNADRSREIPRALHARLHNSVRIL